MKTAKIGVLFLVALMALAGVGAGYALWSETITISGVVNTGEVDIQFSNQKSNDPTGALSLDPMEHGTWLFGTGAEIYDPYYWTWTGTGGPNNPANGRWDKDVASIDCQLIDKDSDPVENGAANNGNEGLTVTITNGYPCYHGNIAFSIDNIGTVPVKIQSIKLVTVSKGGVGIGVTQELVAGTTYYIDADTGAISQTPDPLAGPWVQDFSITMSSLVKGQQIDHPGIHVGGAATGITAIPGDIDVHVEQGASELASYDFTIQIWGVQWNEYT